MALDPNIILAAGKATGGIDPSQLLAAANQIKLGQLAVTRGTQTQDALDRVRADPTDMKALGDLAALDPTAAEGYAKVQDLARQSTLRQRRATLARTMPGGSLAPDAVPLNAVAPQAAPALPAAAPQPTGTPLTLPGTGATINIPTDPSAPPVAPAAPAAAAPTDAAPADHPLVAKSIASTTPTAQMVGSQISNGKLTPQEAAAQLLEVGDPKDIAETTAAIKGLNDDELADYNQKNKAMADAVSSVKGIPDDATHSARMAALLAKAPQLQQIGITPQMLVHADLSDRGINGTIGQAAGYQGMFDNELKLREAAQKDATIAETKRKDLADEDTDKTKVVGMGSVLVGSDGKVLYDSNASQGGSTKTTGGWTPRARNGGDNSDAAVDSKIAGAAQFLGVNPTADISKLSPMQIAQAMTLSEGGKGSLADRNNNPANLRNSDGSYKTFPTKQAGLQAAAALVARKLAAGQTSVQTMVEGLPVAGSGGNSRIEGQAQAIARGDQAPFSGRAAASGLGSQIMNRVYQINPSYDGKNYGASAAAVKGFDTGKQGDATRSFSVAMDHMNTLSRAANALQNGNLKLANSIGQSYAEQTGSAVPTNFDAVKAAVSTEIAKAIGGGHLTDASVAGIEAGIKRASSPAQLNGYVSQMQDLLAGQLAGYHRQYTTSTGRTGQRDDYTTRLSAPAAALMAAHERATSGISTPPAPAVAYLRANPNMRAAFDAKYGAGSSASILGR